MVKTLPFGDIQIPTPGFGAMGLSFGLGSNLSLEEAEPVLLKAIELGCTFWDTAVVYQAGVNEKLLGDFIRKHNVRDKVFSKTFYALTRYLSETDRCCLQLPRSVVSTSLEGMAQSPTPPRISRSTSREPLRDLALLLICTICTGLTPVSGIVIV
jgi:aryl-alcohol dehydrogenase-like predicted oxidoreductase